MLTMIPLTIKERTRVLDACELIETKRFEYSCIALQRYSQFGDEFLYLRKAYTRFYGKRDGAWVPSELEDLRSFRIILLLLFAEVGRFKKVYKKRELKTYADYMKTPGGTCE